jgi:hypothetical protein
LTKYVYFIFICADKSNENSFDTGVLIQIKKFVCKQFPSPPYVVLVWGDGYLQYNCILSEVVHACDFIQVPKHKVGMEIVCRQIFYLYQNACVKTVFVAFISTNKKRTMDH